MFNNRQELTKEILRVKEELNISIMDSIVHICEQYGMEIEAIAVQIKQSHKIKEELRKEAVALRMVEDDDGV